MSDDLLVQLDRARSLGFLGPGPAGEHRDHAAGFLVALPSTPHRLLDLGSGGGVPGLVLAVARPDCDVVLVDALAKRCRFLEQAVVALHLSDRVSVVEGRAEELGRGELRGAVDVVVARSFGPPAVVAECAAPLLRPEGRLVVSEPPDDRDRWPAEGLAGFGLAVGPRHAGPPALQELHLVAPCPEAFPRRNGIPAKRPRF